MPKSPVILWNMRRRLLLRRRRRRYVRRRKFPRRRRLWIRRPRAGMNYVQRIQHSQPLTITFTGYYKSILVTFNLHQFLSQTFFDYYRILKCKWQIHPATPPNSWSYWGYGMSILDYDDNTIDQNPSSPPWPFNSTRRLFSPQRKHSRYFTPKPKNTDSGAQSKFFPVSNRQWWWNAAQTNVDWLGVKACFYNTYQSQGNFTLIETKTIWIRWKNAI